jgi:hypothetical protein
VVADPQAASSRQHPIMESRGDTAAFYREISALCAELKKS